MQRFSRPTSSRAQFADQPLNATIASIVFAYALRARTEDFRFLLRERRLLVLSLLSIFVVTPVVALAVVEWIEMPTAAEVAGGSPAVG